MPARVQSSFREPTDMGFWDKSLRVFNCLCDNATQSVRRIAQPTGLSKSSVHRLTQARERRDSHPESWLWETAAGRQWLTRLVVATLSTFGRKRGVGLDTMREFFARLRLDTQVGWSPSALRGVMQALATALLETAGRGEKDGGRAGEVREIIGAVDETFLPQMLLVFQDVPTGDMVQEAVADARSYATWKAVVEARLTALGTGVLSLVRDRAKAFMQLAEKGLECLRMPDVFHVVHESIKSYALAIGRCVRHAQQELTKAEEALARRQGLAHGAPAYAAAQAAVEAKRTAMTRWEAVQRTERHELAPLSLTLHPFRIADSTPQTSAQVANQLTAAVEAIEAFARCHPLPARHDAMTKVRKPVPALAALVDFWWQGVHQDLEPCLLSPRGRQWVSACLLPMVYWANQVARTRCHRRKANMQAAWQEAQAAFHRHPITQRLAPHVLAEWQAWATDRVNAFQRASSAVEGRNGFRSPMHHNHRGLPKQRSKVWTVLHHFDCRAPDGTTPASRFFRRAFPDLFETVLSHGDDLPRPRQRNQSMVLSS
jgi:Family of unknown function (DUF6399)/IclR helix-turn-helix domain